MSFEDGAAALSMGCTALFFAIATVVWVYRRPKAPPDLPAMSDLGPESPAVANLLANGGRLTPDAVPATLFDLAARRAVRIEETAPGEYQCRLGDGVTGLKGYESRVLDLLRTRASGGVIPAHALTSGPTDEAKRWFKNFRGEVVGEATAAGECERRWPRWVLTAMGFLVLGALYLGTAAGNEDRSFTWPQAIAVALALAAGVVMAQAFTEDMVMLTPAGAAAQGRWVSLRKYLRDDEMFANLPPTAVAVRERYLAYGAALGVAATAVRAIPMGAESDRWAWTNYGGGGWRQVRVSYPERWPLAWGSSPWDIGWTGLWMTGVGALALWVTTQWLPSIDLGRGADEVTRYISIGVVLVTLGAAAAVTLGLIVLCAAVAALVMTRTVTGEAIRVRQFGGEDGYRHYLAVYTGKGTRVRAFSLRSELYPGLREYAKVTVSISPVTGYVRTVQAG